MRAELLGDYAPRGARERLIVEEIAHTWQRLAEARQREQFFFDLQRHACSVRDGVPPGAAHQHGAETVIFLDQAHSGYAQILRAIRDAEIAFDRALRRAEQMLKSRLAPQAPAVSRNPRAAAATSTAPSLPEPATSSSPSPRTSSPGPSRERWPLFPHSPPSR